MGPPSRVHSGSAQQPHHTMPWQWVMSRLSTLECLWRGRPWQLLSAPCNPASSGLGPARGTLSHFPQPVQGGIPNQVSKKQMDLIVRTDLDCGKYSFLQKWNYSNPFADFCLSSCISRRSLWSSILTRNFQAHSLPIAACIYECVSPHCRPLSYTNLICNYNGWKCWSKCFFLSNKACGSWGETSIACTSTS